MKKSVFAYPRPQLMRENWTSLNGVWKFAFDDDNQFQHFSDPIPWNREITVPYPPESEASGIGDRGYHYACWYQRKFSYVKQGHRVLLHFGARNLLIRFRWPMVCCSLIAHRSCLWKKLQRLPEI